MAFNYGGIRRRNYQDDYAQVDPYSAAPQEEGPGSVGAVSAQPISSAQPDVSLPQTGYQYNYPGAPNRAPASTFQPNTQTDDINRMWRDNRTSAIDQGNVIDQQISDQYNRAGTLDDRYRFGTGMQSPGMEESYGNLSKTPGYTPDETAGITRENQFNNLVTPDWEYQTLDPTGEEAQGIRGNTGSYGEFFDPDQLRGIDANYANMARGQVAEAKGNVSGALDQQRSDFDAAVDPSAQNAALKTGAANVRSTIDPRKLRYDQGVADSSRITDADVRDWQGKAARSVGQRYASAKDAVVQGAAASGNADPLSIAAARSRLENQEAVGSADALTDARISGRMAQTQRNMDLERERLAAEQGYSGLASANEQTLAGRELATAENTSGRRMAAAGTTGANALQGAEFTGDLATGVEGNIGGQEANTGKYISTTGTGIRQAQDVNASSRERALYDARNANKVYSIGNKFNQGFGVNQQLSTANTKVADTRRAGEGEYRGWLTDQADKQQQATQTATGQRIANYGVKSGATNAATSGVSNWEIGNQDNTVLSKAMRGLTTVSNAARAARGG